MTIDGIADEFKALGDKMKKWLSSQAKKQEKRSGAAGWAVGLAVTAVALLTVGFMYYRSWKQGKKLAKLLHDRDVEKKDAERLAALKPIKDDERAADELRAEASKALNRAADLDKELELVTTRKQKTDEAIEALKNWRDIDHYLLGDDGGKGSST